MSRQRVKGILGTKVYKVWCGGQRNTSVIVILASFPMHDVSAYSMFIHRTLLCVPTKFFLLRDACE